MNDLDNLNNKIINCKECPRLVEYIANIKKRKGEYWCKPLTGFGDPNARLLIIGLAPAAHGGNRTGRMFTGDSSGDWLVRALYLTGFANQPISISKDDGLILKDVYITAAVRCAPPNNKPNKEELKNCVKYLKEELRILNKVKIVLTLGSIAFNVYTSIYNLKLRFAHNVVYKIGDNTLVVSYHPSRQNTQTHRLTWDSWLSVFNRIRDML